MTTPKDTVEGMAYCSQCEQVKSLEYFSKERNDIPCTRCKSCRAAYFRSHYEKNRDKYKKKDALLKKHPDYKEWKKKASRKRYESEPEKANAVLQVNNAVKSGTLVKEPCEKCGSTKMVDGHHDDYSKPLDVRWLCRKHHAEHHKLQRQSLRTGILTQKKEALKDISG